MGESAVSIDDDWIWERVAPCPMSGCWLWAKGSNGCGYGTVWLDGRSYRVHRLFYTMFVGDIPPGMMVCHKCDVRSCCNPDHLFAGTALDNNRDRDEKGRARHLYGDDHWTRRRPERLHRGDSHHARTRPGFAARGELASRSKLTTDAVIDIFTSSECSAAMAEKYNVSTGAVRSIRDGDTWRHVTRGLRLGYRFGRVLESRIELAKRLSALNGEVRSSDIIDASRGDCSLWDAQYVLCEAYKSGHLARVRRGVYTLPEAAGGTAVVDADNEQG